MYIIITILQHSAPSTPFSECNDGDIQLVGGDTPLKGRLEVCINNAWGTVCNNQFGNHDSATACHQLGFERTGQLTCSIILLYLVCKCSSEINGEVKTNEDK